MTNSSSSDSDVKRLLFVCYGNTCRSPMAHAVMSDLIRRRRAESKLVVDSAGISNWQEGQEINKLAKKMLLINGVQLLPHHRARQISVDDFEKFDLIIGMDTYNIQALWRYQSVLNSDNRIVLLGDYNPDGEKIIDDPFFDNREEDFAKCYRQIDASCRKLLDELISEK